MRQSFYAIGMLMLFVSFKANAQTNETSFITRSSIANSPLLSKLSVVNGTAAVKVSMTAEQRFAKDFKDAKDVEWVIVDKGYRAFFMQDAILTAVDYTLKGKLYSVIRYGKGVVPGDVVALINKSFDGAVIIEASEVKIANFSEKVYVVVLEDKTSMKSVQVMEGQIEVINEMAK
jgi:hypothetical protein